MPMGSGQRRFNREPEESFPWEKHVTCCLLCLRRSALSLEIALLRLENIMRRIFIGLVLILLCLPMAAAAQEKPPSLAELARKEKAKVKTQAARVITNDDLPDNPEPVDYPNLGVRFAMPRGWESPQPERNAVRAACPGHADKPHDPRFSEQDECGLYVAIDGLPSPWMKDPRYTIAWVRDTFLRLTVQEVTPWREFTVAGLPAGEHTIDIGKPGSIRRMRLALVVDVSRDTLVFIALIAKPELFEPVGSALDTVLKTLTLTKRDTRSAR